MSFEARDYVLITLGSAFGVLMLFASGLPTGWSILFGLPAGAVGASCLCQLGKPRVTGKDR